MATLDVSSYDLNFTERAILGFIDRRTPNGKDCWMAAETIGKAIGRSARTVQAALTRFKRLRIIRTVTNYALRTRRAIILLWRRPAASPLIVNAEIGGHCPQKSAPADGLLPFMSFPEGNTEGGNGDDEPPGEPEPIVESAPAPASSSPPDCASLPPERETAVTETRPPDSIELKAVVSEAEKLFGGSLERKVVALAKQFSLDWVRRAIDQAVRYRSRGKIVEWGLLIKICRDWLEEGGPPPEPARPETWDERRLRVAEMYLAVLNGKDGVS
jgi:hypothetical protein